MGSGLASTVHKSLYTYGEGQIYTIYNDSFYDHINKPLILVSSVGEVVN